MLRALSKSLFFILLLMVSGSLAVRAEVKQYQYDGKLPFVQMMLNMMVAMGMLDRVPVSGLYGSSLYPGSSWSNLNNPYMRALALRGLSPGLSSSYLQNPYLNSVTQNLYGGYPGAGYGNNPFLSSPWLQSPWSQPALNSASPLWGSPSWGVLPTESYPLNNYWSGTDLTGWVNEPWETSSWNPEAESRKAETNRAENQTQSLPANSPLVQIYNSTTDTQHRIDIPSQQQVRPPAQAPQNDRYGSSPLSKLVPPDYRNYPPMSEPYAQPPGSGPGRPPQGPPRSQTKVYQKPCVTDFCGLKKPDLDGFWVAQNGEMLGIKNQQFLWSDGASRYLSGRIKVQNEYLLASVEGHEQIMTFKYKLAGNHLLTLQPDGVIREFTRMTATQYYDQFPYDQYQGYGQDYRGDFYP